MNIIFEAIHWLSPIVHAIGLGIALWAYRKCQKKGYIVVAAYFALAVFSLVIMPPINHAISAQRKPDVSEETEKKLRAALHETTDRILAESGQPAMAAQQNIDFPLGPILLVIGLWLVAKEEKETPNKASDATSGTAPGAAPSAHQG